MASAARTIRIGYVPGTLYLLDLLVNENDTTTTKLLTILRSRTLSHSSSPCHYLNRRFIASLPNLAEAVSLRDWSYDYLPPRE